MGFTFSTEELEQELVSMSKKLQNEVLDEALNEGAKPVIKAMDKNVPIDTGELSDSLGEIKKEGSSTNRKIHLGSTSTKRKVVERAYYQEYGNSSMLGKKWMKKSYEQSKDEAVEAIADSLTKNLFK